MNSEELDSQLSAMFDDELPAEQCELLARRLARDELLKSRWGRYAAIGSAMRAERGVSLTGSLARRVSLAIANEPPLLAGAAGERAGRSARLRLSRWSQPLAGAGVAAAVAIGAILWLRAQSPLSIGAPPVAFNSSAPTAPGIGPVGPEGPVRQVLQHDSTGSDRYVVPRTVEQNTAYAAPAELADLVVAHSAFSAPFLRRNVLSSLMSESGGSAQSGQPAGAPQSDDRSRAQDADQTR